MRKSVRVIFHPRQRLAAGASRRRFLFTVEPATFDDDDRKGYAQCLRMISLNPNFDYGSPLRCPRNGYIRLRSRLQSFLMKLNFLGGSPRVIGAAIARIFTAFG